MSGSGALQDFVQWSPTIASVAQYADSRVFDQQKRDILVNILSEQYRAIGGTKNRVLDNIQALHEMHTFTITTGQQVHAFLGPVFFVTKILDCIATAEQVSKTAVDKKFVPVFWMASEDHDFAEVNTVSVYNTPFVWNIDGIG